jgi:hypothetical protein
MEVGSIYFHQRGSHSNFMKIMAITHNPQHELNNSKSGYYVTSLVSDNLKFLISATNITHYIHKSETAIEHFVDNLNTNFITYSYRISDEFLNKVSNDDIQSIRNLNMPYFDIRNNRVYPQYVSKHLIRKYRIGIAIETN